MAVADGIVIGVGTYEGETEIDLEGKVICPGFIDSHLHLESTLVTPGELVRQAAQCGTTTFIVDPHESANVSGTDGIDYIPVSYTHLDVYKRQGMSGGSERNLCNSKK